MNPVLYLVVIIAVIASYLANNYETTYTCHYSTLECMCIFNNKSIIEKCSVGCAIGNIGKSTQQKNGCPTRIEGLVLDSFSVD